MWPSNRYLKRFFTRSCSNRCDLPEVITKSHEMRRKIKCSEGEKAEIKFRVKYDNISTKMNHFRPIFDLKCPFGSPCKYTIVSKRYGIFWIVFHQKYVLGVKMSSFWNSNSFHWQNTILELTLCIFGTTHRSQSKSHSLFKMLMSLQWEQIVNRKEEPAKVKSNIIRGMDQWNVCQENSTDALVMDSFA